jgi:hypothetical protein
MNAKYRCHGSTFDAPTESTVRMRPLRARRVECILLSTLALAITCVTTTAHAGTKTQGTKTQGTKTQGTKTQGTKTQGTKTQGTEARGTPWTDEWLWGTRLHGVIPEPAGTGYQLVEVIGFRGDTVEVLAWRAETGWRRHRRSPASLVGMRWLEHRCHVDPACPRVLYRIRAVRRDSSRTTMPAHPRNDRVWLFDIEASTLHDDTGQTGWTPVCRRDRGGARGGLFVDGHWRPDGSWRPAGYTFSCPSGVIAKCVRGWGYKPWRHLRSASGVEVALAPLHRACVRAARADYCGDGISYTRDGTSVDMFDQYGFNIPEGRPGFAPEAGFSERGAAWLQRPRHGWPRCSGATAQRRVPPRTDTPIVVWSQPSISDPGE